MSTMRMVLMLVALALLVIGLTWVIASIPTCTTGSSGVTYCARWVTPFHREIWME